MGAAATNPLRPGDTVAGRWDVDRVIGAGGMGAVVAAHDRETGARVAVKTLLPEHCAHADLVARFQREARATARLKSPNVVRVIAAGALPEGVPYIVMELLDGRDLKSLVKQEGPLSIAAAANYVRQAAAAVAEAHGMGIIHRDLKPANIFLTRGPNGAPLIKVLDFGIAKFQSAEVAGDRLEMTRTRAVLGSRAYMSPEQMLRPREVDARTDVWALGVILYFLVAGRTPFAAATTEALILNVANADPPPLASLRGDVPVGFEAVVLRCLTKSPEGRFASVAELGEALAPYATESLPEAERETLPVTMPRLPEQSEPSVRAVSVTNAADGNDGETVDVEPDPPSRSSVASWAPTQVMKRPAEIIALARTPRAPVPKASQPTLAIGLAVLAGFAGALLLIRSLPSEPAPVPAPAASVVAPTASAVASASAAPIASVIVPAAATVAPSASASAAPVAASATAAVTARPITRPKTIAAPAKTNEGDTPW